MNNIRALSIQNVNTKILSTLIDNIVSPHNKDVLNYQKFNGSKLNMKDFTLYAWRAQTRPYSLLPTYPYITMDQLWEKYYLTEYAGVLLYKPETNDFNYAKYRHLDKYRVEDPRLYMKSDSNIYMSYVGYIPEIEKTGQWEFNS